MQQIFDKMAENENVLSSELLMYVNDLTIDPYDTPSSLKLTIADTIGKQFTIVIFISYCNGTRFTKAMQIYIHTKKNAK